MVTLITVMLVCAMFKGPEASDSHQKRFIVNSNTAVGQFCTFCPLRCSYGYVTASSGCLLCRCKTSSTGSSSSTAHYQPNSYLANPCQPHIRFCSLKCSFGFRLGKNGCQYCACALSYPVPTPRPHIQLNSTVAPQTTQASKTTVKYVQHGFFLSNPCSPHIRFCSLRCLRGLKQGPKGCKYCQCDSRPNINSTAGPLPIKVSPPFVKTTLMVTTSLPATVTVPPQTLNNKNYNDPCIPSQVICNRDCGGRYVKGPQGCQYCICASKISQYLRPTTTIAPSHPYRPANDTHRFDHQVMTEACLVAKTICQLKCPSGFKSKPENCLYCKCRAKKDDQDDPPEDPGFTVQLPNPCVLGIDQCELMCPSGYLMGPRNCEFCTCR